MEDYLMEERITLPPITSLMNDLPVLSFQKPTIEINDETPLVSQPVSTSKMVPYTPDEDMLIMKAVASYFGATYSGKVPFSFWQALANTPGVNRSSSSLYHRWNGAIMRKYGYQIDAGRLGDCIAWVEFTNQSAIPKKVQLPSSSSFPLRHNFSLPSASIQHLAFPSLSILPSNQV